MRPEVKEQREYEILEAAKEVFLKKGYINSTMEDIIDNTSLSKGGVYYYFKNKEDICFKLMENFNNNEINLKGHIPKTNDLKDILSALCDYMMDLIIEFDEDSYLLGIILIENRNNLSFKNKVHEKVGINNVEIIAEQIYDLTYIEDKPLFEEKLRFLIEIFHAMFYYKYIETIDFNEFRPEIKNLYLNIFDGFLD